MSGSGELHERAGRVADLSGRMVRLARCLEELEDLVAEVTRELEELGLADRLGGRLAGVSIPAGLAETLQDELDQISGELENRADGRRPEPGAAASAAAPGSRLPVGQPGRLLAERRPVDERLMVKCQACGRHFPSAVSPTARHLEHTTIDERTYRCPHCGSTGCYETWDHFLE